MTIDQLSWEKFFKESKANKTIPKKISSYNRMVAYSKNFFLISGYGAFTGYIVIVAKEFIPSFGFIDKEEVNELNFLIKIIKENIDIELKRKSIVFEHGMCACVGGLDRAHLHIMSIPKKTTKKSIKDAIEQTIFDRKLGIKYIRYKNYKLENIHDINEIYGVKVQKNKIKLNKEFKVIGKLLNIKNLKNLDTNRWPLITNKHVKKQGSYVYFNCDYENVSFLTKHNFQTQFGREVVFNIEKMNNVKFKKKIMN